MTISLYAQPYDLFATGFYFTTKEEYEAKASRCRNDYGQPVEEYEIQFIDGEMLDVDLAEAWGLNQCNFSRFLELAEEWEEYQKILFIIAVGEVGYSYDHETVESDDFEIDLYHVDSLEELAEQFVEEGLFGDIPERLQFYIDMDAIVRDLAFDYTETEIASQRLVYRAN